MAALCRIMGTPMKEIWPLSILRDLVLLRKRGSWPVDAPLFFFGAQAMGSADAQVAGFRIFESDGAPLHGQGVGKGRQNGFHGLVEIQGLADDLTNFIENL